MTYPFALAKQVGRVPSMTVRLGQREEIRFQTLIEECTMIDLHQHPMVFPEDMDNFIDYLRTGGYQWGYESALAGGWSAVTTANVFRGMVHSEEISFIRFEDLAIEIGMMLGDLEHNSEIAVKVTTRDQILNAKQRGVVGVMPTVEHLAIGDVIHRIDILHAMGVRIAGLTYNLQNYIGSGLTERHDAGLTEFGLAVIRRMNDLGMVIDVSHAGVRTAMDAVDHSGVPILYSHNASHSLRPSWRTRYDEELIECAKRGGLVAITAVPNSLSDDPKQDINCVLDHYDYLVKLLGVDHVAVGTDTLVGDHVGFHAQMMGKLIGNLPAPYMDGLESPADGKNIVRGLISRGYTDSDISQIIGGNAMTLFRRVLG